MPHHAPGVVVDPEEVDVLPDLVEIGGCERRPRLAEDLGELVRISPEENRVEELPVHVGVGAGRRGKVLRGGGRRNLGLEVHDEPDLVPPLGTVRSERRCVRPQEVVRRDRSLKRTRVARGEGAVQVAAVRDDPRLVERRPPRDAVVEGAEHDVRVVGEPRRDVAVEPPATIVHRRRQVPVEQRDERRDARLAQRIGEALVEVEPLRVDAPDALRQHPAPRHAEPVGRQTQFAHERRVLAPEAVVVARHVAGLAREHPSRSVGEPVPGGDTRPVGQRRSLDLVRRRRRTPGEPLWEQGTAGPWRWREHAILAVPGSGWRGPSWHDSTQVPTRLHRLRD